MSKEYICELCKKVFNQKIDFTRHQNKKSPCISMDEIKEMIVSNEKKDDMKTELVNLLKSCLNILRDTESLTGEKALRNMSYILILKLIEPHIGIDIDFDNYDFDFSHIEDELVERHRAKLLSIARFTNLANEKEDNIPINIKYLWSDILAIHPATKNIFLKDKSFDIQRKTTFKTLIDKFNSINLNSIDDDILGDSYELVIQDIMTGKVFGQFFTPHAVKDMMIKLIEPKIFEDGKIESCCDPTMGTGGFLITYLKDILKQSKIKKIIPDWNFIINEGLYGKELEPDTYQLAISNMLINSGHMFENMDRGDSIREPITRKFDNILANPPFGIKGFKYDDFDSPLKFEYTPIKTENAVSLFIQAMIYMLKINGKCAVVLPDGQDLFSKSNATLVAIREYLLKTCDLKEVIYLPSGIFTYTSIKTCVFFFVKKREGTDVLKTNIKLSRTTQKETGRTYDFSKTHQTRSVKFYDYNPYEEVKNLLVEVPIEDIARNSYSLNYAEYLKDNSVEEVYDEGVVIKTLGEVCEFQNGYAFKSTDYEDNNGSNIGIIQIKSIQDGFIDFNKITEYITENDKYKSFEITKGDILIAMSGATTGKIGIYNLNTKLYLNQRVCKINSHNNNVLQKYIYYWYICSNISDEIINLSKGTAQPNVSISDISGIQIPIPSLQKQQEIVVYLDFIYDVTNKLSKEKIAQLKQMNEFRLNNQKMFGKNEVKTLGEVCDIEYGTRIVKSNNTEGEYPVYGSGRPTFTTDTFNRDGYNILIGRFALSQECVRIVNEKLFLNDSGLTVQPLNDTILHKYIGYFLLCNQELIYNCARGTAQKNLDITDFKAIEIPIPTIEIQKQIVNYCDHNSKLIKCLEEEIQENEKLAKAFLKDALMTKEELDAAYPIVASASARADTDDVASVTSTSSKKSTSSTKSSGPICLAVVKSTGLPCTKRAKDGCQYCGTHAKSLVI